MKKFIARKFKAAFPAPATLINRPSHIISLVILLLGMLSLASPARADRIDRLVHILQTDRSYKVKLKVLIALGKLKNKRAVPAMIRILSHKDYSLRGVAAAVLAQMGDRRALPRLRTLARSDPHGFVRDKAKLAIKRLSTAGNGTHSSPGGRPQILLFVGKLVNTTGSGKRPLGILKTALLKAFSTVPKVTTNWPTAKPSPGDLRRQKMKAFSLMGVIKKLKRRQAGRNLEITSAIQVSLLSYPGNSLRAIYSGEATLSVQARSSTSLNESLYKDLFEGAAVEARKQIMRSYLNHQ